MNIYTIYKITNLINNKVYIGQTKHIKTRIQSHKKHSSNRHLRHSISLYGVDNFTFEELCVTNNKENISILEEYFINLFSSNNIEFGYNIRNSGVSPTHSDETKKILSEIGKIINKGVNNPNYGNYWSDEQKKHLSNIQKSRRSWVGESNPKYGKYNEFLAMSNRDESLNAKRRKSFKNTSLYKMAIRYGFSSIQQCKTYLQLYRNLTYTVDLWHRNREILKLYKQDFPNGTNLNTTDKLANLIKYMGIS